MARLRIELDVDVDSTLEDPHEVADEIVLHPRGCGVDQSIPDYAGNPVSFMSAEWVD